MNSLANINYIQALHRRTAIEYGLCAVKERSEKIAQQMGDEFLSEMESTIMAPWVCEFICQGAYIREYHVWEKEVREYLNNNRNSDQPPNFKGNFVDRTQENFTNCNLTFSTEMHNSFEKFRKKVNTAKHDMGVLVDHFVSEVEVWEINEIASNFWLDIANQENA